MPDELAVLLFAGERFCMGFDIYGVSPMNEKGDYFRNTIWQWGYILELINYSCQDILTDEEFVNLGWNNGYEYNEFTANQIAERLEIIANDEKLLEKSKTMIMGQFSEPYEGCWTKDNILEFVEFLKNSGGFEVC